MVVIVFLSSKDRLSLYYYKDLIFMTIFLLFRFFKIQMLLVLWIIILYSVFGGYYSVSFSIDTNV